MARVLSYAKEFGYTKYTSTLQEAWRLSISGLLPICANCKKVRDDKGYWRQVEQYISEHTGASFSHAICPECVRILYPGIADAVLGKKGSRTRQRKPNSGQNLTA
jgi:hypothetical protein